MARSLGARARLDVVTGAAAATAAGVAAMRVAIARSTAPTLITKKNRSRMNVSAVRRDMAASVA